MSWYMSINSMNIYLQNQAKLHSIRLTDQFVENNLTKIDQCTGDNMVNQWHETQSTTNHKTWNTPAWYPSQECKPDTMAMTSIQITIYASNIISPVSSQGLNGKSYTVFGSDNCLILVLWSMPLFTETKARIAHLLHLATEPQQAYSI